MNNEDTTDDFAAAHQIIPEQAVADRWGKSVRTLQRMRRDGVGPTYVQIGRSVFYLASDLAAYEFASRKTGGPQ